MIQKIVAIGMNTYREAIRQKVLYVFVLFTVVMLLLSLFLGQLTLGADVKIIKDMGLASMMIFGALISIFVGVGLVFREVERKTIYTILSKPVSRAEFILGKYVGLVMILAVEILLMFIFLYALLSIYREPFDWNLLKPTVLIFVELCVLVSVALVFSSYSSSMMSIIFCILILFVGHLTDDLVSIMLPRFQEMVTKGEGSEVILGKIMSGVISGLEFFSLDHFVINAKIVHGVPVSWNYVFHGVMFGTSLQIVFLSIAVTLFKKKDLQ